MRIGWRFLLAACWLLVLPLAVEAQDSAGWRASLVVGGVSGVGIGAGVQRQVGVGVVSSRIEAVALATVARPTIHVVGPSYDTRDALAVVGASYTAELGPRRASGARSYYLLLGAGLTALRWDDGVVVRGGQQVDAPRAAFEPAAAWSGGIGYRSASRRAWGLELRAERVHTRVDNVDWLRLGYSIGL